MLEDVVRILRLINERPNERFQPNSDDLQGYFTSWFDGGAVSEATGHTFYKFADSSKAMVHVLGYFYITITLADGTKISVIEETQRAGKELLLKGQQLLSAEEKVEADILERPDIEADNSPTIEFNFPFAEQFGFCTRCGHRVEPYLPSKVSHNEIKILGKEPPNVDDEPHYWCLNCKQEWLALSYKDTSVACKNCKTWMPFIVEFCGNCGVKCS